MKLKTKQKLVILDKNYIKGHNENILLWNSYEEKKDQRSILSILEKNSDEIRLDYLSFIAQLGKIDFNNKNMVEHLKIDDDFSLWWMSLLSEKGTLKSKTPLNCLKIFSLNKILNEEQIKTVQLISKDRVIATSINLLCKNLNIVFQWENTRTLYDRFSSENIRKKIPNFFQALMFFVKNIFMKWNLRNSRNNNWLTGGNTILFFSYFLNIDFNLLKKGQFYSQYWNSLPSFIKQNNRKINWIHHFMTSNKILNTNVGNKYLKGLNDNSNRQEHHNFLYSFISIKIIFMTLSIWFKFFIKGILLKRSFIKEALKLNNGWLTPIIIDDWKSSVYGKFAIQNILWIYLLQKSISTLPLQKTGLYLCENQGWERAFIYFWKKYGHGELIGVAHTMIRYWDLRYYEDLNVSTSTDFLSQPRPNKIAINGPISLKNYLDVNQQANNLEKVEAIRFESFGRSKKLINNNLNQKNTLLVLGDYVLDTTIALLSLLNNINPTILNNYNIIFKSHPSTIIEANQFNNLNLMVSSNSISEILPQVNAIISSGNTTAPIEGIISGLPLIVVLDNDNFNFSPFRGVKGVRFAKTGKELEDSINQLSLDGNVKYENQFFWIDSKLPRWKALLNL